MTPKEKAAELMVSYRFRLLPFITFQNQLTETDLLNKCKQCALISVQLILDCGDLVIDTEYWEEVKKEINYL